MMTSPWDKTNKTKLAKANENDILCLVCFAYLIFPCRRLFLIAITTPCVFSLPTEEAKTCILRWHEIPWPAGKKKKIMENYARRKTSLLAKRVLQTELYCTTEDENGKKISRHFSFIFWLLRRMRVSTSVHGVTLIPCIFAKKTVWNRLTARISRTIFLFWFDDSRQP